MLPSNLAASGLPIKASKAGLDACEDLSVAACCDVAYRRLLPPSASASARRESSATSEVSSSIQIALERAFSAKHGACCLGDAVFSRAPNWVGQDFIFVRRPSQERLL